MSSVPERGDIDPEYKWDLESIYAGVEDWEHAYEEAEAGVEELEAFEDRLAGDPPTFPDGETLLAALQLRDELSRQVETVAAWARMRSDEDTRDQQAQALSSRGRSLSARASAAASFVDPAVQALSADELEAMVEATPGLAEYDHYLDDVMRLKPHTRSREVEAVLSELGEVLGAPQDIYGMLTDADMTFPTVEDPDGEAVEITQSNFTTLLQRGDREFRRSVHEAFYGELESVRNTVGTALENQVKRDVRLAETRGYETARGAALDGPNVPVAVYDTLVETVHENLGVLHRHADLKARALGVDELAMWDLYAPIAGSDSPEISYETATDHVVEALGQLGDEYRERVEEGLASRWVDVYESHGKRSGAYSGGTYDTQPFILMNWQEDIASMYTLAHELGHSLHSEFASETQPYVDADYEIFVAEVASTVNEALLTHHLLETVDEERFRRHVLDQYLERFRSTLFRQTMFADFEQQIHAAVEDGEALTPDSLDESYEELKSRFYEPAAVDEHVKREWMRIPHFYYNFYVYQYATGISAAAAIARRISEEGQPAVDDYLDALKLGGSEYPVDILDTAGVDVTTPAYLEAAITEYDDALDRMEGLLG